MPSSWPSSRQMEIDAHRAMVGNVDTTREIARSTFPGIASNVVCTMLLRFSYRNGIRMNDYSVLLVLTAISSIAFGLEFPVLCKYDPQNAGRSPFDRYAHY